MRSQGIIVGCDNNQEWLLPWFWDSYALHNQYPITFMDFGMSEKAKAFCAHRGDLLTIPQASLNEVDPLRLKVWQGPHGDGFMRCRPTWFAKPQAFTLCPYQHALWLDLDCKVHGPLHPVFAALGDAELALVKEPTLIQQMLEHSGHLLPGQLSYNSGVIAFKKGAEILSLWHEECLARNELYRGDQDALNFMIYIHEARVLELPSECNWLMTMGKNDEALISHYASGREKIRILQEMKKELWPLVHELLGSVKVKPSQS